MFRTPGVCGIMTHRPASLLRDPEETRTVSDRAFQKCINPDCAATFGMTEVLFRCPQCGSLLDVEYDWDRLAVPRSLDFFEHRWATKGRGPDGRVDFSGVWRFRELLPFATPEQIVTIGEGRTVLERNDAIAADIGMKPGRLFLQYEGLNPSGSFKDNGMTAAFTLAKMIGRKRVACASTGNTSASVAMFAHKTGMEGIVFIGSGKIAYGKLSQALDYGALTLQIDGDFDACMKRVVEVADKLAVYLMNSMNPFRLEGQKAIMYRILESLDWQVPDWIIVPGGNLGNSSAFGKAFAELHRLGLVSRVPRLAVINATGANTLYTLYEKKGVRWNGGHIINEDQICKLYDAYAKTGYKATTVASAIEIGRPVNLTKCLRALEVMNGVVREVSDEVILEHKALVGRLGLGCEPASAASVAGLRVLRREGVIGPDDLVACVLTGHELKDPDATVKYHTGVDMKSVTPPDPQPTTGRFANPPVRVKDNLAAICAALGEPDAVEA
jgi:threonine synthase